MISVSERQNDIINLISRVDISPTMYKNAEEKYKALASFLNDYGIKSDIYPQGSFALGTVVRPATQDPNANYDLDFICQVYMTRDDIAPSKLRQEIEEALKSDRCYRERLKKCGECFTIEYADIGNIGFSIDIVPATEESTSMKKNLLIECEDAELIESAIAIPRQNGEHNYDWITNNPRGFKKWFDDINKPFLEYGRKERLESIFNSNRTLFESVEDIPSALERSSVQRAIQILKYHRDTFYQKLKRSDKEDIKPISAIINTLVAYIAKSAAKHFTVFELLEFVIQELNIYALQESMIYEDFQQKYGEHTILLYKNGKWFLLNPANPKDNLTDKWNTNPDIPCVFFKWISACRKDLIDSIQYDDDHFFSEMTNVFGSKTLLDIWGTKYGKKQPESINKSSAPKPYRNL